MIDLGFITSNRAKLAHFKLLARDTGLEVFGFREKTFHASYTEPRTRSRQRLLEMSYRSALQQWKKSGLSEDDFFFIEDTSVIIDALSEKKEVPGTDIKYWMRKTAFASIDRQLRERGNNRRVTVRSDIVLHVPLKVRIALNMPKSYLWVYGESKGTIVRAERRFASNSTYPWLDNRSFNKWFVPTGERVPISQLPIRRSLKHDFRRKAFDRIIAFFSKLNLTTTRAIGSVNRPSGLIFGDIPPTYIICGYSCAGKTTLADYLVEEYGYMHFEASDFMRVAYHERLGHQPEVPLSKFAGSLLRREPWVVPEKILAHMEHMKNVPVVITGFRSPAEVEFFIGNYTGVAPVNLLFVDATFETRFRRALLRDRTDDSTGKSEMERKDKEQTAMGLGRMAATPGFINLANEATLPEYYEQFAITLGASLDYLKEARVKPVITFLGPLEEVVLLALATEWSNQTYFTSTEIAKLIRLRQREKTVAKDNVSRYFNQRYSPFYQFSFVGRKRKFRLSQTGHALERFLVRHSIHRLQHRPTKPRDSDGELVFTG